MIERRSYTPNIIGIKEKKDSIKEFFIRQKVRLDMGRNNLAIFQWVMLLFITIKTAFNTIKDYQVIIIVLIVILGLWVFGYFWDKLSLPEEEKEFQNRRDRFVKEVRQNINKT